MKLQEYLEQDREKFLAELAQKKTPEQAVPVVQAQWDRVLYRYNADCESQQLRECAAGMTEAVKASAALVDSVKEVKVWERTIPSEEKQKASDKPSFLLGTAVGCLGLGVLLAVLLHAFPVILSVVLPALLFIAGAVLAFLGGRKTEKGKAVPAEGKKEQQTELLIDAERIFRYMKASAIVMDMRLDQMEEELRYAAAEEGPSGEELSDALISLYGDMLEALYSGDGEFALERLKGLTYYLHGQGIEVELYSESTAEHFDRMPGIGPVTIRPAMLRNGVVLKKGLAVA